LKSTLNLQPDTRRSLTAAEVMEITRHQSRCAFWGFVHKSGFPCIRLNSRNIVFDAQAVEDWLQSRTIGGKRA
jgi:predicted DNA-binding transcriptional regulator AlpA